MKQLSWWRRTAWAALVMLACGVAAAADAEAEIGQLSAAIDARTPAASGKESKKLTAARKRIDRLEGPASIKDQAKILVNAYGSRTEDAGVLTEADDLLDCLLDTVRTSKSAAELPAASLTGSFAKKFARTLAKSDKPYDKAVELLDANPGKAANLLRKAYDAYAKAARLGEKLEAKQAAAGAVAVPSKFHVVATLAGDGFTENFTGDSLFSIEFNTGILQGCKTARGSDACDRTVNMSFFYPDGSRETGPRSVLYVSFEDYTDTPRYYESFNVTLEITKSTATVIEGTFSATMESLDEVPETVRIEGAFRARRR